MVVSRHFESSKFASSRSWHNLSSNKDPLLATSVEHLNHACTRAVFDHKFGVFMHAPPLVRYIVSTGDILSFTSIRLGGNCWGQEGRRVVLEEQKTRMKEEQKQQR